MAFSELAISPTRLPSSPARARRPGRRSRVVLGGARPGNDPCTAGLTPRACGMARRPLAPVLVVMAVGGALPLWQTTPAVMLVSAMTFGGSFFAAPTAIAVFSRNALPPSQRGEAIAGFTTLFALCQCLALQLRSPFYVGSAGFGLMCASPDGPCDDCLLYTSPSPRDRQRSRMPSSA